MEEMKNFIRLVLPLLLIISFTSCATTSGTNKEKHQSEKKLLFKDWKYRGFGYELPVWFEAAYHDNQIKLKSVVPELNEKEVTILRGDGFNSDQSEQSLKLKMAEKSEDFIFYDSGWAMIQAGKYVSLAILYKESPLFTMYVL